MTSSLRFSRTVERALGNLLAQMRTAQDARVSSSVIVTTAPEFHERVFGMFLGAVLMLDHYWRVIEFPPSPRR